MRERRLSHDQELERLGEHVALLESSSSMNSGKKHISAWSTLCLWCVRLALPSSLRLCWWFVCA